MARQRKKYADVVYHTDIPPGTWCELVYFARDGRTAQHGPHEGILFHGAADAVRDARRDGRTVRAIVHRTGTVAAYVAAQYPL